MRNKVFARKAMRQARRGLRREEMSLNEFEAVKIACNDEEILTAWKKKVEEVKLNPWKNPISCITWDIDEMSSWQNFWDWFKKAWPDILSLLLEILPLLLIAKYKNEAHNEIT